MTTYQDPPLQSRRAARQGERPESSTPPFAPPQLPRTAAGAGEPLSYVTQNRPPLPGYGTPAAPAGRRAAQPAPEPAPTADPPTATFRPRDYSPEARTAPPAWSPAHDRESGMVEYHTQARAQVAPQAASLAESLANEPNEQTLTRRELRQIRDAANVAPAPAAPAPAASFPAAPAPPAPSPNLDAAIAEFDARTSRGADDVPRRAGRRAAPAPVEQPAPVEHPVAFGQPVAFEQPAPSQSAPAQPAPPAFAPQEPTPAPAPVAPHEHVAPPSAFPAPPAAQPPAAAPVEPVPVVAPPTGERPVGHWTTQSDLDEATQVSDSTISRTIGSGAITTSALVLPALPGQDMTTGEVLLTGSINLSHAPIDESDIDHLLDPGDHQLVNTDSVPIRAIKAVSSHTGSRPQLIATTKPKSAGRALTALIVSASAMVVVVVTLLVVALVTDAL